MATATFNGRIIASSDDIEIVEGNAYFPIDSLAPEVRSDSSHSTFCPWKGKAAYWDITVDGETATDAAWYYPKPKKGATKAVADRVAFYPVVEVDL
ncbi:MAG: DUF427 domain-containing protein [Actinomycetia bacterium]|nr:DUF427 domain-containing protein [Actinomycetes bacterium]MCP4962660.1 DUF427 domain-containing protein [Actinomycetes bacterium]